jgi:Holliday junction DNA helicase RuvA
MIASVRGQLLDRDPAAIVVDVGGVGYQLAVPLGVFERLPAAGEEVFLHTELVVREDAWSLYGFDSAMDRAIFRKLLGATGVGARLALAMLSSLGPSRTVNAIRDRDLAALSTVPGIGKKKAERIALELAERFDDLPVDSIEGPPRTSTAADAVRALMALGYQAAAAEDVVRKVAEGSAQLDTATLVRRSLTDLTRG